VLSDVVIVGASLAGLRAAETLRTEGYDGRIALIGAEHHLPYDRPPLSKRVLSGELALERIQLRKEHEYADIDLDLHLGVRATGLDPVERRLTLSDGTTRRYEGLIVATGSTPRRLPGQVDVSGIAELRTLEDCLQLRAAFTETPQRVVVIGGGFIGAEVAATARRLGLPVTIIEALPAPLVRGLGMEMGGVFAQLHRDEGVDVRLGVGVAGFDGAGRVERIRLVDGSVVEADVVLVGIGVAPTVEWLAGSGLELRDGVVCDATLAAGPPGVYCAGDITRWPNALFGVEMRVEHWTNASEQGAMAARNLLAWASGGEGEPYASVPFFWSDQYDARIQLVGHPSGEDDVAVVHGSPTERRFVALYGRNGRLTAALGVSSPKVLMSYRRLLAQGVTWEDAVLHASASG
jgi:NADPH-dependent 2,4-dienoyl-CoA reductase/sulfur reductase-like enzyme